MVRGPTFSDRALDACTKRTPVLGSAVGDVHAPRTELAPLPSSGGRRELQRSRRARNERCFGGRPGGDGVASLEGDLS